MEPYQVVQIKGPECRARESKRETGNGKCIPRRLGARILTVKMSERRGRLLV